MIARRLSGRQHEERVVEIGVASHQASSRSLRRLQAASGRVQPSAADSAVLHRTPATRERAHPHGQRRTVVEDVEARPRRACRESRDAAEPGEPKLPAKPPADPVADGPSRRRRARASARPPHEAPRAIRASASRRRGPHRMRRRGRDPRAAGRAGRGPVDRQVLPEVGELQRRADRIRLERRAAASSYPATRSTSRPTGFAERRQ